MCRLTAILAMILSIVALTGCTRGFEPGPETDEPPVATQQVKIVMWNLLTNDRRQEAIHESILAFNRVHEHIQIVPYYFENEAYKNKLRVAMLSNHMPDVFYYWFGESFKRIVDSGVVADLTTMLDQHPDLRDSIYTEALQKTSYSNRVFGIPHSIQHVLIWYSKPIFEQYGLEPPQTWDELANIVDTLRAKGIAPVAAGGKERWQLLHWYSYLAERLGGEMPFKRAIDGTGDFTDASFIKAAELFNDFASRGAFMPGYLGMDQPQAEEAFLVGEAAMFLQGDWAASRILEDERARDKLGYFRFPEVRGKGVSTVYQGGYSVGWAVSNTADLDAAFEVLNFMMSREERTKYVEISGTPSTVKGVDVLADRLSPAVREYISFIQKDATGYFGFYDQEIDYRRQQQLLDASVALSQSRRLSRQEIKTILANIK